MDRTLRDILTRLAGARDASTLGESEWTVIDEAIGRRTVVDPDAPRPLWAHIREQVIRWKAVLELPLDWMGSDTDVVFLDAGVATSWRLDNGPARRYASLRRDALVRSVQKHLGNESTSVRSAAALLIGLARLDEVVPTLIEALTSGREERNSWGAAQVLAPMLESLAMLEHPRSRELAVKFVAHSDDRLRRAAQVCTLLRADELTDVELAKVLDAGIANPVMLGFPEAMARAGRGGLALEARLQTLESNCYRVGEVAILAQMSREAQLRDYHRRLLGTGNWEPRTTVAIDLIGSKATWALDAARAQLANESDEQTINALIGAVSNLLPDDASRRAFLIEKLKSGRTADRVGGCWAALPVSGLTDELAKCATDSEEEVRRAAGTALMVQSPSCGVEMLEVRWLELSRMWRQGTYALACRMVAQTRHPVPWPVRDAEIFREGQAPWQKSWLDGVAAFYREAPERLIRRMSPEISSNDALRMRASQLCGYIGGPVFEAALEARLTACDSSYEAIDLCIECASTGGPRTPIGRVAARLLIHEATAPVALEAEDLAPVLVLAARNDSTIRSRAAAALYQLGDAAAPYLGALAGNADTTLGRAVGQSLAQLPGAADPYVAELADLMAGRIKRLADLSFLDVIVCAGSPAVRAKVAEIAVFPENEWALIARHIVTLAGDNQDDVAIAALTALARRAADQPWVQALLVEKSRGDNWSVSRQTIDIMGAAGRADFVPRLVEMLDKALTENDSDRAGRCVAALQQIADGNPNLGLLVFDVREPGIVNTRYGMREDYDWNQDRRAESVRLLMLALDRRKNADAAKAARGKTALFSRSHASVGPARPLAQGELDGLAVFFRVTFSDADTGDIVAEVGDEPTGELLNALLQTHGVSVCHGTWS